MQPLWNHSTITIKASKKIWLNQTNQFSFMYFENVAYKMSVLLSQPLCVRNALYVFRGMQLIEGKLNK